MLALLIDSSVFVGQYPTAVRFVDKSRPGGPPGGPWTARFSARLTFCVVIVLLPPSETKRVGGDRPPLRLDALGSPALGGLRSTLVDELIELAADHSASRRSLGLSPAQDAEIDRNAALRSAPTLAAFNRYTGVLYDALDIDTLSGAAAGRARSRLVISSPSWARRRARCYLSLRCACS